MLGTSLPVKLFASEKDGDPANYEKYPRRYVLIQCAQCKACVYDKLAGRCLSGGPFDPDMAVTDSELHIRLAGSGFRPT